MKFIIRIWLLCLLSLFAGCSLVKPSNSSRDFIPTSSTLLATPPAGTTTTIPPTPDLLAAVPHCDGIRVLQEPVKFYWPRLEDHLQQFSGTVWVYYACEQPRTEVSNLFREELLKPPFNLQEVNWFEKAEGTLGVYFSQRGAWNYVWIVPQPGDPRRSYVIVVESFAYIEC